MLLTLDVGNSQIHGGVFAGDTLRAQFRKTTHPIGSSDELGVFLRAVLRENQIDPAAVARVAICSVVPPVAYPLRAACVKYFRCEPFLLQAGVKTGLKIKYRNPAEVGADRVANAIAATQRCPGRNCIVVDCGTATTFDVVTAGGDYLGGAILPGLGISAEMLSSRTARLPAVEIFKPESALGRSTVESIQAGLYHGHVGAIRQLVAQLTQEAFAAEKPALIGTGGFSRMFEAEQLFDELVPELVLFGLKRAEELNREPAR
ncbi:Type III pantothenate kinase [Lacunisphaera limnophila]|uniref:Type III pantothenate kinase n=1 Tax=Lacunisphaera limnophila TaxID=1838286 RepID=A0A1D8AV54_9BACT|nr:type III pantothenate kinase [Lacunisphaera limnophila]AOS44779.1 Type III pantothenate kinase [Lacunisphaera limnophila]